MTYFRLNVFGAALLALFASVGVANAQLTLVPNGDFATAGGANWVSASVGAVATYPAAGGNTGGFGQLSQTAAGWGGVLVSENSGTTGRSLASLGVTPGMIATFNIDLINLGAGAPVAGMKIENWNAGAIINDSTDITFATTGSWVNHQFNFLVAPTATSLKFVPLLVVQPVGSIVGFDNVGVFSNAVPEPGTFGLVALGVVGLIARRRRS